MRDLAVTVGPLFLITVAAIGAAYWFVRPAPPDTIMITSGPIGSTFRLTAEPIATRVLRLRERRQN